jgi:DNA-binding NtrC family response regulator
MAPAPNQAQRRFWSGIGLAHDRCMNTMTAPTKEGHLVLGNSEDALTVWVLDDEQGMVEMLQESRRWAGFSSIDACDSQHALELIDQGRVRVVMSNFKMARMQGLQFLEHALHHDPGVYAILKTGFYSLDNAIADIKRGAYDYVSKPVARSRLKKILGRPIRLVPSSQAHSQLRAPAFQWSGIPRDRW